MKKTLFLAGLLLSTSAFAKVVTLDVSSAVPVYEGGGKERICDGDTNNGNVLGTLGGATAGGVLGHQIGKGKGKTVATIAGGIIGGYIGNKVEQKMKGSNCRYVQTKGNLVGYKNIAYYNGKKYSKFSERRLSTITVEVY